MSLLVGIRVHQNVEASHEASAHEARVMHIMTHIILIRAHVSLEARVILMYVHTYLKPYDVVMISDVADFRDGPDFRLHRFQRPIKRNG